MANIGVWYNRCVRCSTAHDYSALHRPCLYHVPCLDPADPTYPPPSRPPATATPFLCFPAPRRSRDRYRKELPSFLRWLSSVGEAEKNLVLYRETAAQVCGVDRDQIGIR